MLGVLGFIALGFSVVGVIAGGVLVFIYLKLKGSYNGSLCREIYQTHS